MRVCVWCCIHMRLNRKINLFSIWQEKEREREQICDRESPGQMGMWECNGGVVGWREKWKSYISLQGIDSCEN